ncbi:MAG: hypothetical protein A2600_05050 [Candidatus Lambdaproteobacteria bacterium RIFOXYD1_FULL_56_27]|uniref:Uncharacterized protein n=1 Tax=Candidatus Lambdaproteobacteria bacterium RIFOXYD2_FULL_56_26 TaxID=1817773 RepID=A0A1F6GRQ8_9PROT|nr:MAG: hypothetical protein A2426_07905 [Candidatus Lambdaproteobacteria bacterium RIFOXYC1_FULL_56_13]OGH00815.1 MAG: hypothetical protein A2557_03835 [Candidatus Lambdaproteobacteria bacterium RIFOXYD2_FULL_56_26]OGH09920.1 MAG: hypothetical protein A2600_05050 [Candidatus Lambdaproteobacteria bacterium RIFOXYD1_FULL_56_27]
MKKLLLIALMLAFTPTLWAASCCGGGSAATLVLPKGAPWMVGVSSSQETYNGYWDGSGAYHKDPANSKLQQTRLSAGAAYRLGWNWQAGASLPYVWNSNRYQGQNSKTNGLGDMTWALWYEMFETIMCVPTVTRIEDLMPAIYFGTALTLPTGVSPYDQVENSFDITGRGFYRLDLSTKVEKSIGGFNLALSVDYGKYRPRPVNREYGNWVLPYNKVLGDRLSRSLAFGYSWLLPSFNSFTFTGAQAWTNEGAYRINGVSAQDTQVVQVSRSFTAAWATDDKGWILKGTLADLTDGQSFPKTRTFSLGIDHVFF